MVQDRVRKSRRNTRVAQLRRSRDYSTPAQPRHRRLIDIDRLALARRRLIAATVAIEQHVLASDANADANPLKDRPIAAEDIRRLAERVSGIGDAVVKMVESNGQR